MRTMRLTQNARLVSSDSLDMERRKALARQMSFRRTHSSGSGSMPMEDITRINRTFSRRNVTPQSQAAPQQQTISRQQTAVRQNQAYTAQSVQTAPSMPVNVPSGDAVPAEVYTSDTIRTVQTGSGRSVSQEATSSYAAQRGALEMRVAKGDLTFLPPMIMTIVTQRPELHFEYLGGYNYVPPLDSERGGNINLFT